MTQQKLYEYDDLEDKMKKQNLSKVSGFTLIELLIVIAVIGVLAAVVLVAINPLEQIARARDAGRKSAAGQLAKAVQAFYTSRQAVYPVVATWNTDIVTAGEIQAFPADPGAAAACSTNVINDFCYTTAGVDAGVWTRLESASEIRKCTSVNPANTAAFFQWSATRGSTCLVCTTGVEPGVNAACNATQ